MGVAFNTCNTFLMDISFFDCNLSYAIFNELKLVGQLFVSCKLNEAEFSDCDLSKANFDSCDLNRTIFSRANLEKTDFSSALNYSINPENNRMTGAIFSNDGLVGLLQKYKLKIAK
tara:strand:- start:297 stop:644 length:348 start_codon:yes stop_codon:yes gene_type:complete